MCYGCRDDGITFRIAIAQQPPIFYFYSSSIFFFVFLFFCFHLIAKGRLYIYIASRRQSNVIRARELYFGLYHSLEMGKIKNKELHIEKKTQQPKEGKQCCPWEIWHRGFYIGSPICIYIG